MKQPDVWAQLARNIVTTGKRPHFAPSEEILAIFREGLPPSLPHTAGTAWP